MADEPTKYLVERKLEIEGHPESWTSLGEVEARSKDEALSLMLDNDNVVEGVYRATPRRFIGESVEVKAKQTVKVTFTPVAGAKAPRPVPAAKPEPVAA